MKPLARAGSSRRPFLFVIGYLSAIFLIVYLTEIGRPGRATGSTWYQSWADQHAYYDMLSSIPKGSLGLFQMPPGYPFLGYIGSFLSPWDPFLIIDYILFLVFIVFSWRVFETFLDKAVALAAALILVHVSVRLFVVPWTTSVTAAALALLSYIYVGRRFSARWGAVAGLAIALTFSARIGDILLAAPVFLLCCLELFVTPKALARFTVSALIPISVIAGLTVFVNYKLSHTLLGPYVERVQSQGFNPGALPRNLYGYILDSWTLDGYADIEKTVWRVVPLLVLAPIGLGMLLMRPAARRQGMVLALPILAWICAYGAFFSVNGRTLQNGSIHYCKALFPGLIASAFYVVQKMSSASDAAVDQAVEAPAPALLHRSRKARRA